jgi:hypothetical protein
MVYEKNTVARVMEISGREAVRWARMRRMVVVHMTARTER